MKLQVDGLERMKVLWICGLPRQVQREALGDQDLGGNLDLSWILGHLPPPPDVELHIACGNRRHVAPRTIAFQGASIHLVPVRVWARAYSFFQFDWLFFCRLKETLQPDIIHGWGTEDAHAWTAIRLSPRRHIVEVQGNINIYRRRATMGWLTVLTALSERRALAKARCVVAENEYSLNAAMPMIRTKAVRAIEHPIRSGFLTAAASTGEAKQILFVGVIEERKGIWDALKAFHHGAPPDWKLAIIGSGRAALVVELRRRISEMGLQPRVGHFPQLSTEEIIPLMQHCSVFLLPTRIDTGPTALKEALAMGLWPVCYDNSGPAHYIRRFQFGTLAEDLNCSALTETLTKTLAAQEWKQPQNRAKIDSLIRPQFDKVTIWRELTKLYAEIADTRH